MIGLLTVFLSREFQYKVIGVSNIVFSQEEVDALAEMGNEKFNSIYLADLNRDYIFTRDYNGNVLSKVKEFIYLKYREKRWRRQETGDLIDLESNTTMVN
jgi:hypothetical protein